MGIPLIQGNKTRTVVNGVTIVHYADPRAAPDDNSRLVAVVMLWCRGLEQRVGQLERHQNADRLVMHALALKAGVSPEDIDEIVGDVAEKQFPSQVAENVPAAD